MITMCLIGGNMSHDFNVIFIKRSADSDDIFLKKISGYCFCDTFFYHIRI